VLVGAVKWSIMTWLKAYTFVTPIAESYKITTSMQTAMYFMKLQYTHCGFYNLLIA